MSTKNILRAALLVVLAALVYLKLRGPLLRFEGRTIRITAIVYCDLENVSLCARASAPLLCKDERCLAPLIKTFYESEFLRITGKTTRVSVDVAPPKGRERLTLTPPKDIWDSLQLYADLRRRFSEKKRSFFKSDVRLFINVVEKAPDDRTETSMGSSIGRIGLVEWAAGGNRATHMWNLTKTLHELGHVFGATDHYVASGKSAYPDGYADPSLGEGSTQAFIDVMSGTRPVQGRKVESEPARLGELRVGPKTAQEMGWLP